MPAAKVIETDVVVIGGGPGGSTVSTVMADRGLKVELFEREVYPRFHIGESLIPETYWVFKRIGMLDKMKKSAFVKKFSVQFVNSAGRESAPFYFHDNKPHECSQTWQVIRSEFDEMMLQNAREHGVNVHQPARVLEVIFEKERAVGVTVQENGETYEVRSKVVVDASGQSTMIQNKLKLRKWDPILNKGAIWTYFRNAYRDTGRDEGATIVIQTPDKKGWFWYIPQHDDTMSVGVVAPFDDLFKNRGPHEQVFNEEVEKCPGVKRRIENAERATGFFATKDYSYRTSKASGDGWVLVGDAYGFLDPLYSSGVLLALKSGELAGDAVADAIAAGDTSGAKLGQWSENFNKGVDRMRRLVCEYYDGFSFGRFIKKFPQYRNMITDLLIGDLFDDRVDEIWEPLESTYTQGKHEIPGWNADAPEGIANNKVNELFLPEGHLR
jgi:flavin-dependent dehydrogenase